MPKEKLTTCVHCLGRGWVKGDIRDYAGHFKTVCIPCLKCAGEGIRLQKIYGEEDEELSKLHGSQEGDILESDLSGNSLGEAEEDSGRVAPGSDGGSECSGLIEGQTTKVEISDSGDD